ncbi:MAG: AAA family ATPase [Candidatus Eremiobacteraeota bacterium]|nr:AAA family ATPase [Candidatus Eremiobacteraeota bacterium]
MRREFYRPADTETRLFGRDREMRIITGHLDGVRDRGAALLIGGEPGVGKTAILEAAKSLAFERGLSVLSAVGVQSESKLPFAGLYELFRSIAGHAAGLPDLQRNALRTALGLTSVPAADLFLIALGALNTLCEFASEQPLLLTVDDGQWLDQSTADILAFIARRIQSEPIIVLIASRELHETAFAGVAEELDVEPLDEHASCELIQTLNPGLSAAIKDRVLRESAGNPLALVELPKAIASRWGDSLPLPAHVPLTARLERAFAHRLSDLPPATRQVLLVAALNDSSNLAEVMSAAELIVEPYIPLEALTPAVSAGLLRVHDGVLHFRHPLVRSAICGDAHLAERVRAHGALAAVLRANADREVWHRAASIVGLDDSVATDLESAAVRALARGDVHSAIQAFDRAAHLCADDQRRGRYVLSAATLASDIASSVVVSLLENMDTSVFSPRDSARLKWLREAAAPGVSGSQALTEIADTIQSANDVDFALDLLCGPAINRWWTEPGEDVCEHLASAFESVRTSMQDDPRFLAALSLAAPIREGAFIIARLHHAIQNGEGDARAARLLGIAAGQVGEFDLAARFLNSAVAGLRSEGRLALLAHVLVLRAQAECHLTSLDAAAADAEEGERLSRETGQPTYAAFAQATAAVVAALRGDHQAAQTQAANAERATPNTLLAEVQMARGMSALAQGRYDEAYRELHRMFDSSDSAYHPMKHCFYVGSLTEAAIHCGRADDAKTIVMDMEALAGQTSSPQFQSAMQHARALLSQDSEVKPAIEGVLKGDVVRSPFTTARLQLALGKWLRRARRAREARLLLQLAMETFDRIGTLPWREWAHQELRAAGGKVQQRTTHQRDELTPQELQIASMVAEGLSNREIGQRLYLSERTVGSHLYRLFPKLGITSRYQLRDALRMGTESLH